MTRGNPLIEAILDAGLSYTSGPQWLAEQVLPGRHVLAVAGTHGKTTTSAMLAWILERAGLQPGFLIGGVPVNFGVSARLGRIDGQPLRPFVIEADEYDTAFFDKRSKFVHYRPRTAVLNNLEFDHADIFDDLAAIERQFHHLVRTVPACGRLVVNARDEALQRVSADGLLERRDAFRCTQGSAGPVALARRGAGLRRAARLDEDRPVSNGTCSANTTSSMRWRRSRRPSMSASTPDWRPRRWAGSTTCGAGSNCAARSAGSRSTTTSPIIRPPSTPRSTGCDASSTHCRAPTTRSRTRILAVFEPRSNTMKLGSMKAQLPWALEEVDLAFCHSKGLDWDAADALAAAGEFRWSSATISSSWSPQILAAARPGDHVLCMSNGGFSGIHGRLLDGLAQRARRS